MWMTWQLKQIRNVRNLQTTPNFTPNQSYWKPQLVLFKITHHFEMNSGQYLANPINS